ALVWCRQVVAAFWERENEFGAHGASLDHVAVEVPVAEQRVAAGATERGVGASGGPAVAGAQVGEGDADARGLRGHSTTHSRAGLGTIPGPDGPGSPFDGGAARSGHGFAFHVPDQRDGVAPVAGVLESRHVYGGGPFGG